MEFELSTALGRYIVVEPYEKSSILKANEISTVFKIISINERNDCHSINPNSLVNGDLIIVIPNSVEHCMMGTKEIYYVRESDIIAKVNVRDVSET